jgi:biopolymer transport protein ExbB
MHAMILCQTMGLAFLMNKTPMELFIVGGPVMWPMLFLSLVVLTVVSERTIFLIIEKIHRDPACVRAVLKSIEEGKPEEALKLARPSKDPVARVLTGALEHRGESMEEAFARAASRELARYSQGLSIMDTSITAAPLLGLLGTVTGMMGSFGEISGELGAPTAITGGIAEALVATACGLFIAVTCLIPYGYLNSQVEDLRRSIDEAGMSLDVALHGPNNTSPAKPMAAPGRASAA